MERDRSWCLFSSLPAGSQFGPQLSSLTFSYSSCQNLSKLL